MHVLVSPRPHRPTVTFWLSDTEISTQSTNSGQAADAAYGQRQSGLSLLMASGQLHLDTLEAEALNAQRSAERLAEEHAAAAAGLQARLERQARGAPPRESGQLQQLRAMVRARWRSAQQSDSGPAFTLRAGSVTRGRTGKSHLRLLEAAARLNRMAVRHATSVKADKAAAICYRVSSCKPQD